MRKVSLINDYNDVYQPVPVEDLQQVEQELKLTIPGALRAIYLHADIDQIKSLPTLLWPIHHASLGILETNQQLHSREYDSYPSHLIAFATNECGDFWVIDSRNQTVAYIDPDWGVEENLNDKSLHFADFEQWLQAQ